MARSTQTEARFIARCQPYRVEMVCGHIETRMMREATAGIPWTPTATVKAPNRKCATCEAVEQAMREAAWRAQVSA